MVMHGKPGYSKRFDEASALAIDAFRPILRKATGIPYITHLMQVCVTVGEYGGDEDQMIAALLHDYLEDIEGSTFEELESRFGQRVAQMVVELSDTVVRPKPPWKDRKVKYLAKLRKKSADVRLVSAADKLHNCNSILRDHQNIGDSVFDRFSADKEGTKWYYREVVVALGEGWQHPLLDVLADSVARLQKL
jgi:(p)ppGpp synthase/HD superfamily hydrolase